MTTGTIRSFKGENGYGFLHPDDTDSDLFFHIREVNRRFPEEDLTPGLRVAFDVGTCRDGRPCAINVRAAPVQYGTAA
jgi:cold shock CspA family protein